MRKVRRLRLTLCNAAALESLPAYFMSVFLLLKTVRDKVERKIKIFLQDEILGES